MQKQFTPMDLETLIRSHFFDVDQNLNNIILSFIFLCTNNKYIENDSGETFYRVPYAEITAVIFKEYEAQSFSPTNLEFARSIIIDQLEKKLPSLLPQYTIEQRHHHLSCYKKFTEHMLLASIQRKYVYEITKDAKEAVNQAQNQVEQAKKATEGITTQFVTILGIFASIIVALFGGMSLVKAAVELLTNKGSLPVFVFVVSVLMLSFSGLIVLLTTWISSLNKGPNDKSYIVTKLIIFLFLTTSCFGSGLISYHLSKQSNENQQASETKFKIDIQAEK